MYPPLLIYIMKTHIPLMWVSFWDIKEKTKVTIVYYSQVLNRVQGELVALNKEEHLELLHKRVAMLQELKDYFILTNINLHIHS